MCSAGALVADGVPGPQARVAGQMGGSRQTVGRWLACYDAERPGGLQDRSSSPRSSLRRTRPRSSNAFCSYDATGAAARIGSASNSTR
ncbi:helix-turn-helix domain-containing protein [Cryptosporangium phraense]|uniref:Helix-turn-helix domain-containing protein n=1 Tax=Cryptosporangium phraense TaxID=2593070 RepID=A0A545AFJ2_9ACTN|nr:helix-turn-helix domain-containing protein [Cryptosporangium phraense]